MSLPFGARPKEKALGGRSRLLRVQDPPDLAGAITGPYPDALLYPPCVTWESTFVSGSLFFIRFAR